MLFDIQPSIPSAGVVSVPNRGLRCAMVVSNINQNLKIKPSKIVT